LTPLPSSLIKSLPMQKGFKSALFFGLLGTAIGLGACENKTQELPILGERDVVAGDTVYHTIGDFSFVNQDSAWVTPATLAGKIYVADFFFVSCPTICPVMKREMLRVYEKFKDNPDVALLSHTIDPRHDSVSVLKAYASQLGIQTNRWHMVTGDKKAIYDLALTSYFVTAIEDSTQKDEGGIVHSGAFLLVDKERRIRGQYDGTKTEEVDKMMRDMDRLLASYAPKK